MTILRSVSFYALSVILTIRLFGASFASVAASSNNLNKPQRTTNTPSSGKSCGADQPFGVTRSALCVRGGEVTEVKTLDEANEIISKATSEGKLVVIDFTATWCGPCKMIAPVYHELSETEEIKRLGVVFLKVDVDENQETASEYGVAAMPTFIFIKDGEVKDRLMGANAPRLGEMIMELA